MHSIVTFFSFLRLPRFPLGPLTPTFTIPIDTYIVSPYTYIYSPDLRASCSIFIPTQDPAITSLRTTQALDEREFLPCAMAVLRVLLTPLSRQKVVQLPHSSMESRSTNEQCETLTSDHVTSALPSVEWRIMWVVGLVGVVCGVFHFSITKMFTYRSLWMVLTCCWLISEPNSCCCFCYWYLHKTSWRNFWKRDVNQICSQRPQNKDEAPSSSVISPLLLHLWRKYVETEFPKKLRRQAAGKSVSIVSIKTEIQLGTCLPKLSDKFEIVKGWKKAVVTE